VKRIRSPSTLHNASLSSTLHNACLSSTLHNASPPSTLHTASPPSSLHTPSAPSILSYLSNHLRPISALFLSFYRLSSPPSTRTMLSPLQFLSTKLIRREQKLFGRKGPVVSERVARGRHHLLSLDRKSNQKVSRGGHHGNEGGSKMYASISSFVRKHPKSWQVSDLDKLLFADHHKRSAFLSEDGETMTCCSIDTMTCCSIDTMTCCSIDTLLGTFLPRKLCFLGFIYTEVRSFLVHALRKKIPSLSAKMGHQHAAKASKDVPQ
jgi:hypothetical protein